MSEFFSAITDEQRDFIAKQALFFAAMAPEGGRISLLPRGMNSLRVLGPNLVGYLDTDDPSSDMHPGSGWRASVMVCAVDRASPVLCIEGGGRMIVPDDDEWDIAARHFAVPAEAETVRIIMIGVDRVEQGHWSGPAQAQTQSPDRHTEVAPDWVAAVLNYWLNEVGPDSWFDSSEEMDARLTHQFRALWEAQKGKPASDFLEDADTALAAIVLFDQFPRNMFRHEARSFSTDALALQIAKAAIDLGYDDEFVEGARSFFYLPFMHSEHLADQNRCVDLFSPPGFEDNLRFAKMHRDIIARFGRFPHRNAVLGRETRPEEQEAVAEGASW